MTEAKLQHELVMWFSRNYPSMRGLFFEVNNDTYNRNHAMKRKSMGMVKGVADMLLITDYADVAGIELKAPGTYHKTSHIKQQLYWGERLIKAGGFYIMSSDQIILKEFIASVIHNFPSASELQFAAMKDVREALFDADLKNKKSIKL